MKIQTTEYNNKWAMIRLLKLTGANDAYLNKLTPEVSNDLNFLEEESKDTTDLNKPILTRKEVLILLGITPPTLDKWVRKGFLIKYGIEGKVFFKLKNILEALTKIE